MSIIKKLSAPVRVYWDLAPEGHGGLPADRANTLADELAGMKVFFVTLRLLDKARPDLLGVISRLKGGGTQVTLAVSSSEAFPGRAEIALAGALDFLVDNLETLKGLLETAKRDAPRGVRLSVSAVPSKKNLDRLASVIRTGAGAGVRNFNLINPNLVYEDEDASDYVLGGAERAAFKDMLEGIFKPLGMDVRLTVHDLFLHKSLDIPGLGGRVEYAGCQAGEAILFIDKNGLAYPCQTMPEPIGDLRRMGLREIWSASERASIRERLRELPEGCAGCDEAEDCMGGCRGLAWAVGGAESHDPGCERG